jgi:transcriptional regulator GlxA family with amidase domain
MVDAHILVVPAWSHPATAAPAALTNALRQAHTRGAQVVGLCLGAFVLGDAGLLDERRATTHWACRELFAQRFPKAHFHPDVLYVDDGNVITSAGTVAAVDCCLHIVRLRHGADVANRVARLLVTPPHRQGGQAQYIEQPTNGWRPNASAKRSNYWRRPTCRSSTSQRKPASARRCRCASTLHSRCAPHRLRTGGRFATAGRGERDCVAT